VGRESALDDHPFAEAVIGAANEPSGDFRTLMTHVHPALLCVERVGDDLDPTRVLEEGDGVLDVLPRCSGAIFDNDVGAVPPLLGIPRHQWAFRGASPGVCPSAEHQGGIAAIDRPQRGAHPPAVKSIDPVGVTVAEAKDDHNVRARLGARPEFTARSAPMCPLAPCGKDDAAKEHAEERLPHFLSLLDVEPELDEITAQINVSALVLTDRALDSLRG
jgi:hypothetical protein